MKLLLLFYTLIFSVLIFAQSECTNADFETGDFTNWLGQTGSCCAINTPNNGIVNGQHTIMTGNGIDPYSCGNVPVVAPGGTFSARLGNDLGGYGAERLRYTFSINPNNTLIIYKYAVILEDPNHPAGDQPRFEAKVLDQNGQIISCTYYYVAAGSGSDFQSCGSVKWKNWTTIGVDVSNYIGQNVTVDFATGDCNQGAHFGYAYVEASCAPFTLDSRYCEIQNGVNVAVLTAPAGFQDYMWSNGATGPSTVITNPQQGQIVTCDITSVNGCVATLEATLTPSNVTASYLPDAVCVGDTINLINNSTYENAVQDSISWSSSDGFSSSNQDFSHVYATPGLYDVQLFVESDAGCVDSISQSIEVYEIPVAQIQSTDVCLGDVSTFISSSTISDNSVLSETWTIDNANYSGNSVDFEFNTANTYDIELISTSSNNCSDTANVSISVFDKPVANFTFNEICEGEDMVFENTSTLLSNQNEYHWNYEGSEIASSQDVTYSGFQIGDNSLELVVVDVYTNVSCFDTISYSFFVHEIPVAQIQSTDACLGDLSTFISSSSISDNSLLSETWTIDNANYSGNSVDIEFNSANTYDIELVSTSTNNCSDTANVTITVFDNPVADFTFNEICEGEDMVFENTSSLLSNQNEYHWNYGSEEISSSQDLTYAGFQIGDNSLELVVGDLYTNVSCFDTISYSFYLHGIPEILYSGETEFCDEEIEFIINNQSSIETNENLSFDWQINNISVSSDTNLIYTIINEGMYLITLIVNSDFGCVNDTTFDVALHPIPEEPILSVTTPICPMDPITFSAEAENNSTIFWNGPNEFSETDFEFTTVIDIEEMGYYTAYVVSQYGCISDTSNVYASILNINDFEDFDFPNIITANNDGINDELNLMDYFKTCKEYTLFIFNRWGNKVFEQTLTSPQFRGYAENGDELEEGVYFYKLIIADADKDKSVKQGFIHVVKGD